MNFIDVKFNKMDLVRQLSNELDETKRELNKNNNESHKLLANLLIPLLTEIRELKEEVRMLKIGYNEHPKKILILKKEILKLDNSFLLKILKYNDHRTEFELFKSYYMNENAQCPIIVSNNHKIKILTENGWEDDYEGYKMLDIITSNIYRTLLSVNTLENIENGDLFMKNQQYLNKFLDYRYKNLVYKKIRDYLKHYQNS